GQLHLAGAEEVADRLHTVEQDVVDDVERRVALHREVEIGLEPLPVAVDDALGETVLELFRPAARGALLDRAVLEERDIGLQRVVAPIWSVRAPAVEDQI